MSSGGKNAQQMVLSDRSWTQPGQGEEVKNRCPRSLERNDDEKVMMSFEQELKQSMTLPFFLRIVVVFHKQIFQLSLFFLYCPKSIESRCKQKWQLYRIKYFKQKSQLYCLMYFKDIYTLCKHTKIGICDYISHLRTVVTYSYFNRQQFLSQKLVLYMFG